MGKSTVTVAEKASWLNKPVPAWIVLASVLLMFMLGRASLKQFHVDRDTYTLAGFVQQEDNGKKLYIPFFTKGN